MTDEKLDLTEIPEDVEKLRDILLGSWIAVNRDGFVYCSWRG